MSQSSVSHTSLGCLQIGAQQQTSGTAAQADFIGILTLGKTKH